MSAIAQIEEPIAPFDLEALEENIKNMYRDVAERPSMKYHFEMGRTLAERLGYAKEELDKIPYEAIESFAGVGNVFALAALQEGEVVLDLGSGSGMDTFYAANKVGKTGEVFGIDMTKEQLEKSRMLKKSGTFDQTYFIDSKIESLPIIANTIDTIISNGVINLSSKKKNVFKEAARVLKPGGKLIISDIIASKKLPPSITGNPTLWAACIGGAMEIEEYKGYIEYAGFQIRVIEENPYEFISEGAREAMEEYGIKSLSILAIEN